MASWISTLLSRVSAARAGYLDELGATNIPADLDALTTAVGKVPKSDAAISWNSTALGAIQDEAEDALEGESLQHLAAEATGTADMTIEVVDGSVISRMLSKTSDTSTYNPTTDAQEMLSDKLGGFSGDGEAAQDDSVKASLDLLNTDTDSIISKIDVIDTETDKIAAEVVKTAAIKTETDKIASIKTAVDTTIPATITTIDGIVDNITSDTQIRIVASGSKTIASTVTKYLSIDSGTNGAEILSIIIKGIVSADWTVDLYVPVVDAVADTAVGDKRDTTTYLVTDTEGGLLEGFAIPFNCFLDFTNDSLASDDIDQVQIIYRSRAALSLAWEA